MNTKRKNKRNEYDCAISVSGYTVLHGSSMGQEKIDSLVHDLEAIEEADEHLKHSKLAEIKEAVFQYKNKHKESPHLPEWFVKMVEGGGKTK